KVPASGGPLPWNTGVAERIARWTAEARRLSPQVRSAADIAVSVCVLDLQERRELCALEAERSLAPASNMKLVTTAAALVLLGPDMEFLTRVEAGGPLEDGVLHGDLIVRAGGDPLV